MEGMQDSTTAIEKRYTLTTAVCLIVSICIGSGIFFKSDNILVATGGNVALGIVVFLLAATTIVFGGLTLAHFASRSRGHGGLISYAQEFLGPVRSTLIGWHYTFLYMPVVCAVICWVVGVYACMVFGLPSTLPVQSGIGLAFLVLCTAWNVLWPRLSGYFQNLSTLAKAAPLLAVGIVGIAFAHPADYLSQGIEQAPSAGLGWIAAAAPVAFAFDGWSSAVSIAPELKDAQRNLPRALVIGPAVILALYLAYFVGISCFLGPQEVIRAGDASLSEVFVKLFGPGAATIPNVIALVAVLGTANGMVLATLRMPFSLALHGQMPCAPRIARVNPTLKFPPRERVHSACMLGLLARGPHRRDRRRLAAQRGHLRDRREPHALRPLPLLRPRPLARAHREGREGPHLPSHRARQLGRHRRRRAFRPHALAVRRRLRGPPRVRRSRIPALGRVELSRETPRFGDGSLPRRPRHPTVSTWGAGRLDAEPAPQARSQESFRPHPKRAATLPPAPRVRRVPRRTPPSWSCCPA